MQKRLLCENSFKLLFNVILEVNLNFQNNLNIAIENVISRLILVLFNIYERSTVTISLNYSKTPRILFQFIDTNIK